jgi:prolyl oligopeptidase
LRFFKSLDGVDIPLTLVHRNKILGSVPILTHLYAYGGFGTIQKPSFDKNNLLLWDNLGGVYAVAHVRGGGEYG